MGMSKFKFGSAQIRNPGVKGLSSTHAHTSASKWHMKIFNILSLKLLIKTYSIKLAALNIILTYSAAALCLTVETLVQAFCEMSFFYKLYNASALYIILIFTALFKRHTFLHLNHLYRIDFSTSTVWTGPFLIERISG